MKRSRIFILMALIMTSVGLFACQKENSVKKTSYTNPLTDDGGTYADPWLIRAGTKYYYCSASPDNSIVIKQSDDPTTILESESKPIWNAPVNQNYSKEIWAPELHYIAGRWYVYFAADDGDNANHRMYVLAGGTDKQNPLAEKFTFKGKVAAKTDRWAIDGTVMTLNDKLYFIWSGWEGNENVAQNIYIAKMSDPTTISGERVLISEPDQPWERHGEPYVNEGPEILKHGDTVSLVYSASGSWTDDYCLGLLALTGDDPLSQSSWQKKTKPVFKKTDTVFGPGHASFITSPSNQAYIVYHAAAEQGSGWDRNIRMQPFEWSKSGRTDFGQPVAPETKLEYQ